MESPKSNSNHSSSTSNNTPVDIISSCSQREKWCICEHLYPFHGFWFILPYLEATLRLLQTSGSGFHPSPSDVILASFPKSGTTWLKALLHSILHDSASLSKSHPQELVTSLESKIFLLPTPTPPPPLPLPHRRILATHLPYQIIGDTLAQTPCKIVYIARNPKDVLVSLWHFVKSSPAFQEDPWDLATAVEKFCAGVVPFGPYYEHVLKYREASLARPENVLFLTYEEMKADTRKQVVRLAEFLGRGVSREAEVEEIVRVCSIESLKGVDANKSKEFPYGGFPMPYDSFFRKGEVGDYKNYLTAEMVERIDGLTREKFYGNGFEYGI